MKARKLVRLAGALIAGFCLTLAVGLLLGYSVITEYPSVLIVGVLFLYALQRLQDRRRIAWVVLAGALIAVGWMFYNNAIFGSPLSLGYSHSELWTDQHESGFMSLTRPHWDALWGITFSAFRGLFVLSPLLLLAWPGFTTNGQLSGPTVQAPPPVPSPSQTPSAS